MSRKSNVQAREGIIQANQSPAIGALVRLAPERECLVKLRYVHARSDILGLTLRFRLGETTDIEQFDINPTLQGEKRAEVQGKILAAFELLSRKDSFHDGLQTMKELETSAECVGFRLSCLPPREQLQH